MNLFALFSRPKKDDMFNLYPDGIFIVSLEGKILDVNLKIVEMYGFSRFDMVGQYFSQFVQGGSSLLNKIVAQGKPIVAKAQTAFEEEKFLEISASKDTENERVYVTARDVTQTYKMQNMVNGEFEIAKKIIDEKNAYLTNISGELLSSLASITGFSKALNDGIGGVLVEKQSKYVNIINKNSKDLTYDLQKLFAYFALESKLYKYEYRSFDLVNLLNTIAKEYEPLFAAKKLLFKYDFSALAIRSCYLDPAVIEDIIKSILDISLSNTDAGTITFNAGNPPLEFLQNNGFNAADENAVKSFAMFEIKDTGTSIDTEELVNIFNPYYVNSQSKRSIGAKITYPIIKKYLKHLHGDVWVYSKPGAGTMVSFVVPLEKSVINQ